MSNKITAITIGDIDGIGIELLIKLFKKKLYKFILITNSNILKNYLKKNNIKINTIIINDQINTLDKLNFNKDLCVYNIDAKENSENAYKSLSKAYNLVKKNYFNGIITLPINKENIINNVNNNFSGHTEHFQKLDKKRLSNMIFLSEKINIFTLTTHIPLSKIVTHISKKNYIYDKIKNLNKTFVEKLKIKKPKFIFMGLNPHAGENGKIGSEEIEILIPAINKLKKNKINIDGPFSSDSIFSRANLKNYDCFISSYHDQALIPFKILSGFKGLNYTGSLSFTRLSPDHGTAYNIVGKNKGNILSLEYCFKKMKQLNN